MEYINIGFGGFCFAVECNVTKITRSVWKRESSNRRQRPSMTREEVAAISPVMAPILSFLSSRPWSFFYSSFFLSLPGKGSEKTRIRSSQLPLPKPSFAPWLSPQSLLFTILRPPSIYLSSSFIFRRTDNDSLQKPVFSQLKYANRQESNFIYNIFNKQGQSIFIYDY